MGCVFQVVSKYSVKSFVCISGHKVEASTEKVKHSVRVCSYIGCTKSKLNSPNITFFTFPTSRASVCDQWVSNSGNSSFVTLAEKRLRKRHLCQLHFSDDSFFSIMKTRLNKDAVPIKYTVESDGIGVLDSRINKVEDLNSSINTNDVVNTVPTKESESATCDKTRRKGKKLVCCCYSGCTKSSWNSPNLSFFQFPTRRPKICSQWLVNCRNSSLLQLPEKTLGRKTVCQLHFTDYCHFTRKKNSIKKNAVPTKGPAGSDEIEDKYKV